MQICILGRKNDKQEVLRSTYALNEKLHGYGIPEKLRSQFVGTCLLCLKNNLPFEGLSTQAIIGGMKAVLEGLLVHDLNKAEKLVALNSVLQNQKIAGTERRTFCRYS